MLPVKNQKHSLLLPQLVLPVGPSLTSASSLEPLWPLFPKEYWASFIHVSIPQISDAPLARQHSETRDAGEADPSPRPSIHAAGGEGCL